MSQRPERLTVRPLTPDDDLEAELDLAQLAFGPFGSAAREQRRAATRLTVAAGRYLGAFDGGTQVASAHYFDLRQWWHGRPLPMAGVAGVMVAPHEQGRGLGRILMTALLEQMAAVGYPLSALYPATAPLYRSLGWELAGGRYEATIPVRSLRPPLPPDPAAGAGPGAAGRGLRPAGPADAAEMNEVLSGLYAAGHDCGPVTFEAPLLSVLLGDQGYLYLAPDGVLGYQWDKPRDEMLVHTAAAGSAATTRRLWSIVASHGTIVRGVRAIVSPRDPVTWLTAEPDVSVTRAEQWMLRLLDAPAAIAGRGFPASVSLSLPLAVTDPQLPANSGDWRLEVSGGTAALTPARPGSTGIPPAGPGSASVAPAGPGPAGVAPAGPGSAGDPLRVGARGLAALYAGTPLASLRRAGLAAGGNPGADAALDDAFAAVPYMTDSF